MAPEQVAFLASVNILQCISLSLMLLQLFVMILPEERRFFRVVLASAAVIALLTPFAWNYGAEVPLWLASLISGRTRSIFPLFPYTAFAMAGAAFGYLHSVARQAGREQDFIRRCARFSLLLCLASAATAFLPMPQIYSDFWYTSPLFTGFRVGILALIMLGARLLEPYISRSWRWLIVVGRESLLIYVVHLLVLYGSAFNADTNLQKLVGRNQPAGDAALIMLLFAGAMVLLALWWNWWKRGRGWQVAAVQMLVGAYYVGRFFLG
jgi:hypothetical protein